MTLTMQLLITQERDPWWTRALEDQRAHPRPDVRAARAARLAWHFGIYLTPRLALLIYRRATRHTTAVRSRKRAMQVRCYLERTGP